MNPARHGWEDHVASSGYVDSVGSDRNFAATFDDGEQDDDVEFHVIIRYQIPEIELV